MSEPAPAFPSISRDILISVPAGTDLSATAASPDFQGVCRLVPESQADGRTLVRLPKDKLRSYTLVRIRY